MSKDLKQSKPAVFAVRPFSSIKGITVEKNPVDPRPVVTAVPKEKVMSQDDDDLLFLSEMAGVSRIHSGKKLLQSSTAKVVAATTHLPADQDESLLFLDALKALKLDVKFTEPASGDDAIVTPPKANRMRQIRRGTIRLDLEIDLHGLTRDEAVDALAKFIAAAARRGQQAVLVIAGKGLHSPGEPVLPGAVAAWLAREGKEWVTEWVPAPDNLGGEGAFVVFLKAEKR